jgi:hypothetical protein
VKRTGTLTISRDDPYPAGADFLFHDRLKQAGLYGPAAFFKLIHVL